MAAVDPYEVPDGETPAQKRERLLHLTDPDWKPGSDPLEPPLEEPAPAPTPAPAPQPAARQVGGVSDAPRKG